MAFLTWVKEEREKWKGRKLSNSKREVQSSPVITPATSLKGSLKGEADKPQLTKLSQPPTAHSLGASQVIHSVWLPIAINWLLKRSNNEGLQPREERGAPLHGAGAGLSTGQTCLCFGYRC